MGDEQSSFKVTDRRLFNADGSPRDIERSAEIPPGEVVAADQPAAATAEAATATAGAMAPEADSAPEESTAGKSPSGAEDTDAAADETDLPGANDPASFINFLMSLATNAAAALGMMPHPGTGESGVDLELAKHWIDVLGMLRQKTLGNLVAKEDQMFEGILADLRMQYVSLTSGPAPPPRFSARDITGGR